MTSFKELIIIDRDSPVPVYMQITNSVIQNIRKGFLPRGFKMPGSRELASILVIHRNTLQKSYDELMAQGWLEIIPRKGTFVVNDLPEITPKKIYSHNGKSAYPEKTIYSFDEKRHARFPVSNYQDTKDLILDDGLPDIRLAPTEELLKEYRNMSKLSAFKKYFRYGDAKGTRMVRKTLAEFLSKTRGLHISENNLLITKGAQMGIYLTSRLLLKPGDNVIVGEPGYFAANLTFKDAGAVIHKVRVDESGIDVDSIEKLCKKKKIRLIYVIPHHHYPTTVTLIPERRIRLLDLAAKYKFAIIEDDYDYDFHYNSSPVHPIASLDQYGNVVYVGTLTKMFVPSIRMGFIAAPENFIDAVSNIRRTIDWQGDSMMETAIAEMYSNGTIERHIKRSVKLYHERRDNFCAQLKDHLGKSVSFKIPDGGMSVWVNFMDSNLKKTAEKASSLGLAMSDGSLFNTGNINYNSARLGFASLNMKEQEKAIGILGKSITKK